MNNIFYKLCVFVAILVLNTSCFKSNRTNEYVKLSVADTLKIAIDHSTSYNNKNLQYLVENNRELLAIQNRNIKSIQVYNLASKKLVHTYHLPKDGKFGKSLDMWGIYLKSLDSVFVLSKKEYRVLLINRKSEVINHYFLYDEKFNAYPYGLTSKPMFMKGEMLYLPCNPAARYNGFYWNHPLFMELNTHTGDFQVYFKGPKEFMGKYWGAFHNHHGYTLNSNDEVVHNFSFSKNLYIRNLKDTVARQVVEAPSKYFDDVPPWIIGNEFDLDGGHEEFYITHDSYKSIYWDKWRKVYYRFAERGIKLIDDNGLRNTWYDKDISIIILDEYFNIINETDLPRSIYQIDNCFVGKKGLYISSNNDNNPTLNEDFMRFHVFKLAEK